MDTLYRWGFWLVMVTGLYHWWHRTYRSLFEKKYKDIELHEYYSIAELSEDLSWLMWKADAPWQLWDVISYPGKAQHLLDTQSQAKWGFDCDDFAVYALDRIIDMRNRGLIDIDHARLAHIAWSSDRLHAHTICYFRDLKDGQWYHIGNWGRGRLHGPYSSREALFDDVTEPSKPIAWATCDINLRYKDGKY